MNPPRVLGLSAGNAGGSAEILLGIALAECRGADVDLVRLTDIDLTGDDAWWLWDRIVECDGLLVSTPIMSRTMAASLKLLVDRLLGPNADAAIIEQLVALRRAGTEPAVPFRVDERVLRPRVAGFLAVGGSLTPQWKTLALPLLHTVTFSMHIAVVDQAVFGGAGTPRSILLDEAALARAALLGANVAGQLGKAHDDVEYLGEPGLCPMCHLDVISLAGTAWNAPPAVARGSLRPDLTVEWTDRDTSVLSMAEKRAHAAEIQETAARHAALQAAIAARLSAVPASRRSSPVSDTAHGLRVEHLTTPLGINTAAPRLSWMLPSGAGRQLAYRLRAGNGWDTGPVASDSSLLIPYAGPGSGFERARPWQVKVWTALGEHDWSAPSWFETGLLSPDDWTATWISPFEPSVAAPGSGRATAARFRRGRAAGGPGPALRHRARHLRGVPERGPGGRCRAHSRIHPIPVAVAGAGLRRHLSRTRGRERARSPADRRLVPRADRGAALGRSMGFASGRAGPAERVAGRRNAAGGRDRAGVALGRRARRGGRPHRGREPRPAAAAGSRRLRLARGGAGARLPDPGGLAGAARAAGRGDRAGRGHRARRPACGRPRPEHQRLDPAHPARRRPAHPHPRRGAGRRRRRDHRASAARVPVPAGAAAGRDGRHGGAGRACRARCSSRGTPRTASATCGSRASPGRWAWTTCAGSWCTPTCRVPAGSRAATTA